MKTKTKDPIDIEAIKIEGWHDHAIFIVSIDDDRLKVKEKELIKKIGIRLYGERPESPLKISL